MAGAGSEDLLLGEGITSFVVGPDRGQKAPWGSFVVEIGTVRGRRRIDEV